MRCKLCVRIVVIRMKIRTYSELIKLPTFLQRFDYLKLNGSVGNATFGSKRYLNQVFYNSDAWRKVRDDVIIRDHGCDLGIAGRDILGRIYIHHLNPVTQEDVLDRNSWLLNPENLICVSFGTHQAIHYGDQNLLSGEPVIRKPGDTKLW